MNIEELKLAWDAQADKYNEWDALGLDEIVAFAQLICIKAEAEQRERCYAEVNRLREVLKRIADHHDEQRVAWNGEYGDADNASYHEDRRNFVMFHLMVERYDRDCRCANWDNHHKRPGSYCTSNRTWNCNGVSRPGAHAVHSVV